jgi:hypothetical protein
VVLRHSASVFMTIVLVCAEQHLPALEASSGQGWHCLQISPSAPSWEQSSEQNPPLHLEAEGLPVLIFQDLKLGPWH